MNTERLEVAASQLVLGLLFSENLANVAVLALEDGCDSPSLRILAGLTAAEAGEARALFERALAEIRSEVPSKHDAVMRLARDIANGILSGMVAPGEGAKQLWDLSLRVPDEHLPELDSFVYAASEWEDCPVFEEGVVAAARELVGMRQS